MKHPYLTKFRKALALTVMLLLLVSLTGCLKDNEPDSTGDTQGQVPPPSTSAPTDAPTDAPPEPSSEAIPEETSAPATEAPTAPPTAPPTEPPATEPASKTVTGTVTAAKLNIREKAGIGYATVGVYYKDDRIEILETLNGWGKTDKGWVSMEYVELTTDEDGKAQEENPDDDQVTDGKDKVLGYGVVSLETLNVRSGPGTKYEKTGTVSMGERYPYYQKDGNWARIDKGWVSVTYFYVEGTAAEGAGTGYIHSADVNIRSGPGVEFEKVGTYKNGTAVEVLAQIQKWGYTEKGWVSMSYVAMKEHPTGMGTVTADSLNIRKQAKVDSEKVGAYEKGTQIEILETSGDWGRTDKGWVSLDYVKMDSAARAAAEPAAQSDTTANTGTVTATGLHIRRDADINSESIGGYKKGDKVDILETKNGWGRTGKGWIWLEYVKMDS